MKFSKYIYIVFCVALISCSQKTLTVNSSVKRINYPGIASASPFIGYEINFESSNNFKIDKVKLNNNEIIEYSLYNFTTRNSISGDNLLNKGKYTLSFKLKSISGIDEEDAVVISVFNNEKKEKITANIIKKPPFRGR